jgi:hypothetical protein
MHKPITCLYGKLCTVGIPVIKSLHFSLLFQSLVMLSKKYRLQTMRYKSAYFLGSAAKGAEYKENSGLAE